MYRIKYSFSFQRLGPKGLRISEGRVFHVQFLTQCPNIQGSIYLTYLAISDIESEGS